MRGRLEGWGGPSDLGLARDRHVWCASRVNPTCDVRDASHDGPTLVGPVCESDAPHHEAGRGWCERSTLKDAGPELLRHWIDRAAARDPGKPFIVSADDGRSISFGELQDLTRRMTSLLAARGIGTNDRVALLCNNSIEHLACYFGVMAYGATICTVHVEMNRNQLDNIFARLAPKLVLHQDGLGLDDLLAAVSTPRLRLGHWDNPEPGTFFAEVARCQPGDAHTLAQPDDAAVILFTSGTSARPKGVVLSFHEHLSNIDPTADGFGITADDRIYDFRSFNWASAQLLGALVPLNRGATLIMAEKFSASRFFHHVRENGATIAAGNPTTINILLKGDDTAHRDNLPTLRFITSSSAPLTVEEWRRFEQRFGIPIAQGYGSSETGWIAAQPGEGRRLGTVGRPFGYHDLAIVDADGRRLPAGEIGHVEIGGFPGHAYRTLADDGSVQVGSRGRIRTGDLGCLDAGGFLTLTGREKELIIRGGVNISPVEIDGVLMQRPEVVEAATVGVPDRVYGEEVVAYVVLRAGSGVDADDILRHCNAALPAFKAPKRIVLSDALPKTERGKLDRKALVELWNRAGAG
jgi:acyl-coenzyme A synthetase/AMP-(fatty) acid ligase